MDGAKVVAFSSLWACYHLATARVWVDNKRKPIWVRKRKGQFYIQTWHSGITNKSGERDEEAKLPRGYVRRAVQDSQMADLFISGSRWQTQHYRRAFWYDGEILESGLPRMDLFFRPSAPIRERVTRYFDIDPAVRFVLYAPTFRNNGSLASCDLDCRAVLDALAQRFGGEWKLLLRLHPNAAGSHEQLRYDADVVDASLYPDINELIVASDWLITDYSSCAFDALEAGKKVAAYVADLEEYAEERGFYFRPEELPYCQFGTNASLTAYLHDFDLETYEQARKRFLDRCGLLDDGHAAERVVDRLLEFMRRI